VKSPDTVKLQWDNFLTPFSLKLWIAVVGTTLAIAVHFTLIYYLGRRFGNQEANSIRFYTVSDSLLLVLTIFSQQGERLIHW
jgi:membrane protein DedA with SNARE-associated domain